MAVVLGASFTVTCCFEGVVTPFSEVVLDSLQEYRAVVPPWWRLEVAIVLLVGERRRLARAKPESFLELLAQLSVHAADDRRNDVAPLMGFGRDIGASAYLALAARLDFPLVTLGDNLRAAAMQVGVPRFAPSRQGDDGYN
ncbi:MAG TPA: type II toxin-antitoxin system VapC family toxin [Trueperaceae bacterium]